MNYHDRAIADIFVAKSLMSPFGNPTNDEGIRDIAAYHVQQGIEKEMKHILHDIKGVDDTTRSFKTHVIEDLIDQVEDNGVSVPDYVKEIAYDLSSWEATSRYSESSIAVSQDINDAITVYERFAEYVKSLDEETGGETGEEAEDTDHAESETEE